MELFNKIRLIHVYLFFLIFLYYAARAVQAIPNGLACAALLLLFVLTVGEILPGLTRLRTALAVRVLGDSTILLGFTGTDTGLTLGLVQCLLNWPQHKLSLGELAARAGSLALQVHLNPLKKVLLSAPSVNRKNINI